MMRLPVLSLALLFVVACGEKDKAQDPVDENLYCAPTAFNRASEQVLYDSWNDRLLYSASDETGAFDQVAIRSYGWADDGIKGPGRYELSGKGPRDCGLCLFAFQNCNGDSCEKVLFADSGAVIISEPGDNVGDRFAGQLIDVILKEIAFDETEGDYLPVPGGSAMCAHGFTFDAQVQEKVASPSCVANGTGSLLGDNIADFTLNDCNGNPVSLHSFCGMGAVRLMAIAGWCSACAVLVPDAEEERNRLHDNGLETLYFMGEADYDMRPTQSYCQQYAANHGVDPGRILLDHNQYAWQALFENVNPYIGDTIGLPWNAVLDGSNMQYIYNDSVGPGHMNQTISGLLTP